MQDYLGQTFALGQGQNTLGQTFNMFEHTCAICGFRLKSLSKAFESRKLSRLHKRTPSRNVIARTFISESGQFATINAII